MFSATLPLMKEGPSYLLVIFAFGRRVSVDPEDVSVLFLHYWVNYVPLLFVHHLPHRGALIFALLLGIGPQEVVQGLGAGDDLVFEVFRTDSYTRETVLGTVLSSDYPYTVHIGYNAIGYSAKSDIVPIAGWSRFPYSKQYRI